MSENEIMEQKPDVTKLCIISLCVHYGVSIVFGMLMAIVNTIFNQQEAAYNVLSYITGVAEPMGIIASWVLMIMARVKNRDSVFAKVIMWIYIVELILSIIAVILLFIACSTILKSCAG